MLPPLLPTLLRPGQGPSVPFIDGHLHLGLTLEVQDGSREITEDELLAWDEDFIDLAEHAIMRLRGLIRSNELKPLDTLPGVWQVRTQDGLAASRMVCLSDVMRPWPLEGAVVCCPGPDQLLVVPLEGIACLPALQSLLRRAARARFERDVLSHQLFWCDDEGAWHHLRVLHTADGVDLDAPPQLIAALERVAAVDLAPVAAEV